MRSVIVLCFLTFFVQNGHGNFKDFLSQMEHAFSVTWQSVREAIKSPVRQGIIGPASERLKARRRSIHIKNSMVTTEPTTTSSTTKRIPYQPKKITDDLFKKNALHIKVTLPLILHPKYKALEAWKNLQHAYTSTPPSQQKSSPNTFNAVASKDTEKISADESVMFGPLVFI